MPPPRGHFGRDFATGGAARRLLGARAMQTTNVLRFASSFLWADLDVAPQERAFFQNLAHELGADPSDLLDAPPRPEEIDPTRVPPELADTVRDVALRAIAADGVVDEREMELFELLDELLPRKEKRHDDER